MCFIFGVDNDPGEHRLKKVRADHTGLPSRTGTHVFDLQLHIG